jgi:hypothetical protein
MTSRKWRGPRTANDPTLSSRAWAKVKQHWRALRLPCTRCGKAIDYDGPKYLIIGGRKRQNPRYLVVGHIISRYEARRRGWTEDQTNAISNSQPECVDCSNRSGARLGQKVQAAKAVRVRAVLDESRRW